MTISYMPGKLKSCVVIVLVGTVFIGSREDCEQYITDNAWKYRNLTKGAL